MTTSYRFSQKYAGSVSLGQDLSTNLPLNYQLGFTRIGLDFITTVGVVYNPGRNDLGFVFEIYPRAQPRTPSNRGFVPTLPFGVDPTQMPTPAVADRLSILSNNFSTN